MKGNIGVTSKDIFPLIKKFMYNDQDIFIREIVSNAVDATQKLITLVNANEYKTDISNLQINVILDTEAKTITVSDSGIGMTEDEIKKYINQIAFSGANEFLEKYSDQNIIGHFGMGFYSSFMVSEQVDILTKSYKDNSKAYKWSCNGTTKYTLDEISKDNVGTDVIMHIANDYKEYLNFYKLQSLLTKYSKYLPIQINLIEKHKPTLDPSTNELKETPDTNVKITSDNALWTKQPSTLKDEDYINFYKELYPDRPEPLFWIHINIDIPFTFTGILYFPAFDPNKPIFEHKHLSLYCNRVFVTDNVDGILPEYLSLLHGVIDSPDIPLNVSRSFLQSDSNVKKINTHIANKVFSSLRTLMKKDRESYEKKWDTIKLFINLGVITQPDIYDKVKDILLLTDIDNIKYTLDEYYDKVKEIQKDKNDKVVYLYTYNKDTTYPYIKPLIDLGYNILEFNDQYSSYEVQQYETSGREQNIVYKRIDSDTPERLIEKTNEDNKTPELKPEIKQMLSTLFESTNRTIDKVKMLFFVFNRGNNVEPITLVVDEYFRRIKEMSIINNQGYFINKDDEIHFIINSDSKIIKKILKNAEKNIGQQITDINNNIAKIEKERENYNNEDDSNKDKLSELNEQINKELENKRAIIIEYAKSDDHINELIDIALLQHGLLMGENLSNFVTRSFKMIEK